MNKIYLKYTFQFILLMFLQIFILNKVNLWGFITPMVYIIFIISLPFSTPPWAVILLAFLTGLTVDFFTGVIGYHALATLIIGFIRPFIIQLIPLHVEREAHLLPIFHDMKFRWYLQYVFLLTLIHHFVYFFVDVLSFHNFSRTILVIIGSTLCSLVCILLIDIVFNKPSKRY